MEDGQRGVKSSTPSQKKDKGKRNWADKLYDKVLHGGVSEEERNRRKEARRNRREEDSTSGSD